MQLIRIGKIINTHGIAGELKVESKTDFPDQRFAIEASVYFADKKFQVEKSRVFKRFWLLKFKGINDIDQAQAFKGQNIYADANQPLTLKKDEFTIDMIIGLKVFDLQGEFIGTINDAFHTKANDVWQIKKENGREFLIPYIDQVVKEVDLEQSRVKIDFLEGLDEN
ncbi:ribosome maturation factor RimM [Oenococcus alcoholitolerans]|uniref:ribosome maturation factor RimM n=1 Tax=Oenococcus alcoholitolerans TaxID=931074 RepID=UPI003F72F5C0